MDFKVKDEIENKSLYSIILIILFGLSFVFVLPLINSAIPQGPDSMSLGFNTTKGNVSAMAVNISGGYISTINITATLQNPRWKAFIGWVTGKFTLSDANSATIFDWALTVVTGRIYATRNSSTILWSSVNCSNRTLLEAENVLMSHTNTNDNITATFNMTGNHTAFTVGSQNIVVNSCPTVRTYQNNQSQGQNFTEVALSDGPNTIYATLLENRKTGYNGSAFDFQMIVPENGQAGFSGATAYYIYLELGG